MAKGKQRLDFYSGVPWVQVTPEQARGHPRRGGMVDRPSRQYLALRGGAGPVDPCAMVYGYGRYFGVLDGLVFGTVNAVDRARVWFLWRKRRLAAFAAQYT